MIDNLKDFDEEIPKWDIALAALAKEDFEKCGRNLTLADFKRQATQHAIRFDDIMVTLFELCIQGEWQYQDAEGKDRAITRDEVNNLYVGGRLADKDVADYTGSWYPLK
ncbi:MAG TPA: hypothetical protein ENJ17_02395 [Gammaproteobacteria bacterium]|nr:hypothetical protein [Gammaproteobacteria bacterium]